MKPQHRPKVEIYDSCGVVGGSSVTFERCESYTCQSRFRGLCRHCDSPRKQCSACVTQHLKDDSSLALRGSEFCAFHNSRGADAIRLPFFAETKFVEPAPLKPHSDSNRGGNQSKKRQEEKVEFDPNNEIYRELIASGLKKFHLLPAHHVAVIKEVSKGLRGSDLSKALEINDSTLTGQLGRIYDFFGFTKMPALKGKSGRAKGQILKLLLTHIYRRYTSS